MNFKITIWHLQGTEDEVQAKLCFFAETRSEAEHLFHLLLRNAPGHYRLWLEQEDKLLRSSEFTYKNTR